METALRKITILETELDKEFNCKNSVMDSGNNNTTVTAPPIPPPPPPPPPPPLPKAHTNILPTKRHVDGNQQVKIQKATGMFLSIEIIYTQYLYVIC